MKKRNQVSKLGQNIFSRLSAIAGSQAIPALRNPGRGGGWDFIKEAVAESLGCRYQTGPQGPQPRGVGWVTGREAFLFSKTGHILCMTALADRDMPAWGA